METRDVTLCTVKKSVHEGKLIHIVKMMHKALHWLTGKHVKRMLNACTCIPFKTGYIMMPLIKIAAQVGITF